MLEARFPPDLFQIPDAYLELIDVATRRRSHWVRLQLGEQNAVAVAETGGSLQAAAGWCILQRDRVSAGKAGAAEALGSGSLDPRMLVQLELEELTPTQRRPHHQCARQIRPSHTLKREISSGQIPGPSLQPSLGTAVRAGMPFRAEFIRRKLQVQVFMARKLLVSDVSNLSSDPFVSVTIGDLLTGESRTESTQIVYKSRSPQYFQTLTIDGISLPGRPELQPGIDIDVHDDDGPNAAAELMGRLHVPMAYLELLATESSPRWLPLELPPTFDGGLPTPAGEILLGALLDGPSGEVDLTPELIQGVDFDCFVIGCRGLEDREGRISTSVSGPSWAEISLSSSGETISKTPNTAISTGSNPSYLHQVSIPDSAIPSSALFAPSLSVSVCRSSMLGGRAILGTSDIDLTKHLEDFLKASAGGASAGSATDVDANGQIDLMVRAIRDVDPPASEIELDFQKGDMVTRLPLPTGTSKRAAKKLGRRRVRGMLHRTGQVGYLDPNDFVTSFLPPAPVGQGFDWMQGRSTALDDLENVLQVQPFIRVTLETQKVIGGDASSSASLGTLKLFVALTNAPGSGRDDGTSIVPVPRPLVRGAEMIGATTLITVRLYIVRGVNLTAKDDDKMSDPFLVTSMAAAVGDSDGDASGSIFWPGSSGGRQSATYEAAKKGMHSLACSDASLRGKEVQPTVIENTLTPYFGQCFEWTRVAMPGPAKVTVEVFDKDELASDDLIGATTIDVEDRYWSDAWRQIGDRQSDAKQDDIGPPEPIRKPVEYRDLFAGSDKISQGQLSCWLEAFPAALAPRFPYHDIKSPPKEKFERECDDCSGSASPLELTVPTFLRSCTLLPTALLLLYICVSCTVRVVVWDADDMDVKDLIGNMNDLYFSGHLLYRGPNNSIKESVVETDIHWRAKDRRGSFNYRLIFRVSATY